VKRMANPWYAASKADQLANPWYFGSVTDSRKAFFFFLRELVITRTFYDRGRRYRRTRPSWDAGTFRRDLWLAGCLPS
jgi:hypothetical protein